MMFFVVIFLRVKVLILIELPTSSVKACGTTTNQLHRLHYVCGVFAFFPISVEKGRICVSAPWTVVLYAILYHRSTWVIVKNRTIIHL